MSKIKIITRDNFTLKKVKIANGSVSLKGTEKRIVDGNKETIEIDMVAKYQPHPDLVSYKDSLKIYLAKAFSITSVFDKAENYLDKGKKAKLQERMDEIMDEIEVTGISIGGEDQLRGVVISGKIFSFNDAKCAINTPRICFSSDNLGFEKEVETIIELIEGEVYKYFYEGRQAEATLFDKGGSDGEDQDESPKNVIKKEEKKDLEVA